MNRRTFFGLISGAFVAVRAGKAVSFKLVVHTNTNNSVSAYLHRPDVVKALNRAIASNRAATAAVENLSASVRRLTTS